MQKRGENDLFNYINEKNEILLLGYLIMLPTKSTFFMNDLCEKCLVKKLNSWIKRFEECHECH
jgi:hypothetical protein